VVEACREVLVLRVHEVVHGTAAAREYSRNGVLAALGYDMGLARGVRDRFAWLMRLFKAQPQQVRGNGV
jgi:hypothetical protein